MVMRVIEIARFTDQAINHSLTVSHGTIPSRSASAKVSAAS